MTSEAHAEHPSEAHAKNPWLYHHFHSMEQQFSAGKLGVWLFLVQEVLFFSGLFMFYIIFL